MMSGIRLIFLLAAIGTLSAPANTTPPRLADLAKLRDPATANDEALRLLGARDSAKRYKYVIRDLRLHRARPGDPDSPLNLIVIGYDLDLTDSEWFTGYKVENPDELFSHRWFTEPGPDGFHPPRLDRLNRGSLNSIIPVDAAGREVDRPSRLTFTDDGYIYDFDRDGTLDLATSTNQGNRESGRAHVFVLRSFDPASRILFRAAYNWTLFPKAPWGFACFNDDDDAPVEIAFGPVSRDDGSAKRTVVYHWNAAKNRYALASAPGNPRVLPLPEGEMDELLAKAFADRLAGQAGAVDPPPGPDSGNQGGAPDRGPQPAIAPRPPFQYHSLKDAGDARLFAFFRGRPSDEHVRFFGHATAEQPATRLPDAFWELPAKEAALAFADANRTTRHRDRFQIAVDDRDGVAPPQAGWLVHHYRSPNCYSYRTHQFALHFGVARPLLIHIAHSSGGFVFANPIEDRATYRIRIVNLSDQESRFIADTVFWLNRIRSRGSDDHNRGASSSSADGHGTLTLFAPDRDARTIVEGTIWSMQSVSASWTEDYEPVTCLNLAEFLFDRAWPSHLGERWDETTPKENTASATRDLLASFATKALDIHQDNPLPPELLLDLIRAVGEEGLADLIPPVEAIAESLPPRNAEDDEFDRLRTRFARDHFGSFLRGDPKKDDPDWIRYQALVAKRAHQPGPLLRNATHHALRQLHAIDRPDLLMTWALGGEAGYNWALQQLANHHPQAHADVLTDLFEDAGPSQQQQIFATLTQHHPKHALQLRDSLNAEERAHLLLDLVAFELRADPERATERIPALFAILESKDKNQRGSRNTAMTLLEQMPLDDTSRQQLDKILLSTFDAPADQGPIPALHLTTAVDLLADRPDASKYWDLFVETGSKVTNYNDFWALRRAIIKLTPDTSDKRREGLEPLVRQRLAAGDGFMNDVFFTALAFDLTGLRDTIQSMATPSPETGDGPCAESAGGTFESPGHHRYHSAREVVSLWDEPDPATRARMWCALIANHSFHFDLNRRPNQTHAALRDRAGHAIRQLPTARRQVTISSMIDQADPGDLSTSTRNWLTNLASTPPPGN